MKHFVFVSSLFFLWILHFTLFVLSNFLTFLYFLKWPQMESNISKYREHKVACAKLWMRCLQEGWHSSGSCRVEEKNSDTSRFGSTGLWKWVKMVNLFWPFYKHVDLFTICITRIIYVSCWIMLELTCLEQCNLLQENNNLTKLKTSSSYKIWHIWRRTRRDNHL